MNASYVWYLLAVVVVGLMVDTAGLWREFSRLDAWVAAATPVAAAIAVLVAGALAILRRKDRRALRIALLGGAAAAASIGLLLTDPQYPAKRIHIAEYVAVSWLVYLGLGGRLGGPRRALAALLIAALLGVHDELIQGLHPNRSFGIRDIVANGFGAAAGALIALAVTRVLHTPDAVGAWHHVAILFMALVVGLAVYPLIAAVFGLPFR
jgi:hypothetical protein